MIQEGIGAHRQSLALTLRRLRTERKLTQSELGRATGISSSFLSLVEQGRSDITIGRLLRLADFYDVSLTDLLGDQRDSGAPVHILRADPDNMIHSDTEGVDVFALTPVSRWTLAPTLSVYQPGGEVQIDWVHQHEGMLFVLDGVFEVEIVGRSPLRLRRGEGAIYRGNSLHRVKNVGKRVGRVLGIGLRHRGPS